MHADDAALHAFLDHELSPDITAAIASHLEQCAGCRERLHQIQSLTDATFGALRSLDSKVPVIAFTQVASRARRGSRAAHLQRWAAVALVALTISGLAIAAPRARLVALMQSLFRDDAGTAVAAPQRARAPVAALATVDSVHDRAGVTVRPDHSLRIEFARWQSSGDVTIALIDSDRVTVRTEAGAATFSSSSTVLGIDNVGAAARYDITMPRRDVRVEIRIAGQRVFLRTGTSDLRGTSPDSVRISLVKLPAPSQSR